MRKFTKAAISFALMIGLCGCEGVSNQRTYLEGAIVPIENPAMLIDGEPITLVYSEVNPPDTITGQLGTEFKRLVELKSSGNITVDLHYSGELCSENDAVAHAKAGDRVVDVTRTSTLGDLDPDKCGRIDILTLPFMFISRDHFWTFATSTLAKELIDEPAKANSGIKGLMFGEEGFRCFFSTTNVESAKDMKGLKFRTYNKPVMGKFLTDLRAKPVDVEFSQLKNALSDGSLDGAEQPITNYLSNKFYIEAPYLIMDNHTLGLFEICMSQAVWDSMTDTQKAVITSTIEELISFNQSISASTEESTLKQLKIEGCTVIELSDMENWERAAVDTTQYHLAGHIDDYKTIYNMRPKEETE